MAPLDHHTINHTVYPLLIVHKFQGLIDTCKTCGTDILTDVKACTLKVKPKDITICVLDCLKTTADCVECVCDIVAIAFKMDTDLCGKQSLKQQPLFASLH